MAKYRDINSPNLWQLTPPPPGPTLTDYIVEFLGYRGIVLEYLLIEEALTSEATIKHARVTYKVDGIDYVYCTTFNPLTTTHHYFHYVDDIQDHYLNNVAKMHLHDAADLQLDV